MNTFLSEYGNYPLSEGKLRRQVTRWSNFVILGSWEIFFAEADIFLIFCHQRILDISVFLCSIDFGVLLGINNEDQINILN